MTSNILHHMVKEQSWNAILKNNKINFILSEDQTKHILKKIGSDVNEEGVIIDSKTSEPEESIDSDNISLNELGAVLAGSKVFIKKNIASFSQYLSEHK